MLSTAQHHYSPMFSPLSTDIRSYTSGLASPQRIQTSGLEPFGHASPFVLHSIQPISLHGHGIGPAMKSPTKVRHHPYENLHNTSSSNGIGKGKDSRQRSSGADEKSNSGSVRRRISRACDQCNQLRTKCDGQSPCAHCVGELLLTPPILDMKSKSIFLGAELIRDKSRRI